MIVRAFEWRDAESVLKIMRESDVFPEEEYGLMLESTKHHFYVAEDTKVVGFICFSQHLDSWSYELEWLCVGKKRKGIGTLLLQAVEDRLKRLKAKYLIAQTGGYSDFTPAQKFYERSGFKKVLEIPDYYEKDTSMIMYLKGL